MLSFAHRKRQGEAKIQNYGSGKLGFEPVPLFKYYRTVI